MAGEGADELFAGYAFLGAAVAGTTSAPGWPGWLSLGLKLVRPPTAAQRLLANTSPWLARVSRGLGFAGSALDALAQRLDLVRSVLAADFIASHPEDPYQRLYEGLAVGAPIRAWEPAKAMLYVWLRTIFADYHMASDRLDMASAVEVRLPYLDHQLFEHVSRLPIAVLAKGGQNKYLLRQVAKPYVSTSVYSRVKKPFLAPPAAATKGTALHDLSQNILRGSRLPFVDGIEVRRLLDSLSARPQTGLQAVEGVLLMLVSLTLLHEHYFTAPRRATPT
jgi:asparagine synthase (glutamine-hydrolysing)